MKKIIKFLKEYILPFLGAFIGASIIMMICEYANSLLFPFPTGMDMYNYESIRQFTQQLPFMAYILVYIGWFLGSLFGTWCIYRYIKQHKKTCAIVFTIILIALGIFNNVMIGAPLLYTIIGILIFMGGYYVADKISSKMKK